MVRDVQVVVQHQQTHHWASHDHRGAIRSVDQVLVLGERPHRIQHATAVGGAERELPERHLGNVAHEPHDEDESDCMHEECEPTRVLSRYRLSQHHRHVGRGADEDPHEHAKQHRAIGPVGGSTQSTRTVPRLLGDVVALVVELRVREIRLVVLEVVAPETQKRDPQGDGNGGNRVVQPLRAERVPVEHLVLHRQVPCTEPCEQQHAEHTTEALVVEHRGGRPSIHRENQHDGAPLAGCIEQSPAR